MVNGNLQNIIDEIVAIGQKAEFVFGNLSGAQINWKPADDVWSVGQCFEHMIKTNELFYVELDKIADGTRRNSFWENFSPFSSFFGKLLVSSLKKDERKFKAPSPKIVPPSEIDVNIIEIFAAHQSELIKKIKSTETATWQKTKITSPFLKLMTYKLEDGFHVVIEHERRHFRQAERVLKHEGFPKN
ncbi:MAG: DinB family protein [Acidobacteriota bacterium]|nr:DinB family protein [Acidobacteriota bacterium]